MQETGKKFDGGKTRYDLLPHFAMEAIAQVLTGGATRYGDENWKNGIYFTRLEAAIERHAAAIKRGEDYDIGAGGDGQLHAAHLAAEAIFLLESYNISPEFDNRKIDTFRQKRIGLDVDDVVADFCGAFCKRFNLPTPKFWNFDPLFKEHYAEICQDKDFWLSMPVKSNPDEMPFEPVCFVSSRSIPKEWTEEWLLKNGFPACQVYHVGVDGTKTEILKSHNVQIFVDDRFDNFVNITNDGVFTYLFDAPHNRRYNVGHRRLLSLSEIGKRSIKESSCGKD